MERDNDNISSGRHMRLNKALTARLSPKDPADDHKELEAIRASLTQVHVNLINYCLKFWNSLQRWQAIVNAMILKSPGDYHIHRLRIIHLYEADFNVFLASSGASCCTMRINGI
jgi:hypothetical protein